MRVNLCAGRYQRSAEFWELDTDIWEVRTGNDIWEVRTDLWEVRTDVQEERSDVWAVHTIKARSAKWAFRAIV